MYAKPCHLIAALTLSVPLLGAVCVGLGDPSTLEGTWSGTLGCTQTPADDSAIDPPPEDFSVTFDAAGVPADLPITTVRATAGEIGLDLTRAGGSVDTFIPFWDDPTDGPPVTVQVSEADYSAQNTRVQITITLRIIPLAPHDVVPQEGLGTTLETHQATARHGQVDLTVAIVNNFIPGQTRRSDCTATLSGGPP